MNKFELFGSLLSLVYIYYAIKEKPQTWIFSAIASALFLLPLIEKALYLQSLLQIFFIWIAVAGYRLWQKEIPITIRGYNWHLKYLIINFAGSLLIGYLVSVTTNATSPYLDATVTILSISTTYLQANKILENWLYWILINALSVVLFFISGLYLITAIYLAFLLLSIRGYLTWKNPHNVQ